MDVANRPLTIKEISEQAVKFAWNPKIPLKRWARTAQIIYHEAGNYLQEGSFAEAYRLYFRFSILVMEHIPKHPEYKTPEGKKEIQHLLHTQLPTALDNLEKIKPLIERDHADWEASQSKRRKRQESQEDRQEDTASYSKHASKDAALSSKTRVLDASENQELAVDLARKEMQRRDANRRSVRQAGISAEEEQTRRIAGFWNNWTDELAEKQANDEEIFRRQMESVRRRLDGAKENHVEDSVALRPTLREADRRPEIGRMSSSTTYHYPSILQPKAVHYEAKPAKLHKEPPLQPPRPPKELISPPPYLPELPTKEYIPSKPSPEPIQELPARPPKVSEADSLPPVNSRRLTFKPSAYLENGDPIRSIFLPANLRKRFLSLAADNTRRGLEMCGILCGIAVNNALFVRCLLIPEQKCTSDTCETENESAMFDYCMEEDLMMLGWIHTHPTQTCFMSSRDLHTQSGYQVMLPESIAIVCAPRYEPSYGIFRLTNPPGLPHILNCQQESTFHPHSVDGLYTGASQPAGHVYESDKLDDFYVHDLRPGFKNTNTTPTPIQSIQNRGV